MKDCVSRAFLEKVSLALYRNRIHFLSDRELGAFLWWQREAILPLLSHYLLTHSVQHQHNHLSVDSSYHITRHPILSSLVTARSSFVRSSHAATTINSIFRLWAITTLAASHYPFHLSASSYLEPIVLQTPHHSPTSPVFPLRNE